MIATRLEWPKRPRKSWDRCFGAVRLTWKDRESGYTISRCTLPDFTVVYPKWADKRPTYHRTLKAAIQAAEEHRNHD